MSLHACPAWRNTGIKPRMFSCIQKIHKLQNISVHEPRNIIFSRLNFFKVFCSKRVKHNLNRTLSSNRNLHNSKGPIYQSDCPRHFSTSLPSSQSEERIHRREPPWRILFFGTDNFSLQTLKVLTENRNCGGQKLVVNVDVVTKHKCPVRTYAEQNGLNVFDWPVPVSMEKYDVGILASFGKLIPQKIIKMFPYGIMNIHPSLLPRWRGSAPIPHTILNGDTETGISIMHIRPSHFDQGPILLQKHHRVPPQSTSLTLADQLAVQGSQMILDLLEELPNYIQKATTQKAEGVTLARKLTVSMGYINWNKQTSQQIDQQYRAFHELFHLRTEWYSLPVKLLQLVKSDEAVNQAAVKHFNSNVFLPGQPFYRKHENVLYIRCKDGWVGFKKIILRKPLTATDFDCGYLSKASSKNLAFTSLKNGLFENS